MIAYVVRRLILGVITIWSISVLSFIIIQAPPGDFVDAYIAKMSASGSAVSAEEARSMCILYGLDRPIWVQYGIGTVGQSAAGMGVRLVSNKLGNIASRVCAAQHCRTPGNSHPETWYYK